MANFLILKKRELATFFQNGENSPQIFKSLLWGGGRWGSLRVRGGELRSHVCVAGIVASEVARWHARWLAGWLLQSSSSPHFYDVYCVPHQVQDRVLQEIFIDHAAGRRVKQTQREREREKATVADVCSNVELSLLSPSLSLQSSFLSLLLIAFAPAFNAP